MKLNRLLASLLFGIGLLRMGIVDDNGGGGAGGDGGNNDGDNSGAGGDDGGAGTDDGKKGGNDGGKPSDAEARLIKDVMKHKDRAAKAETELQKIRDQLKNFEGIDPVKVRELLAQQEEQERKKAEAKGDYDRLIKQMAEAHQADKKKVEDALVAAQSETGTLKTQIAELTVGNAFGSSRFVADELTLTPTKARVIYGPHFAYEDGQVVGYDKPAGASERTKLVDANGDPLPFEAALKKLVETDPDKEHLIRSKMKPGAGSSTSTKGSPKPGQDTKAQKLSPAEKIQAGLRELAKKQAGR